MTRSLSGVHPTQKKCAYCGTKEGLGDILHGPGHICDACSFRLSIPSSRPFFVVPEEGRIGPPYMLEDM